MLYAAAKKVAEAQGRDITRTKKSSGKGKGRRPGKRKDAAED